jgi:peptidoglycan/xylan/chitin deacetylase (PgdA/CDA1 family)
MIPSSSRFVQSLFPSLTWNASGGKICLTFDDGPHPRATPAVLETLESYGIKATFFFLGRNVAEYPQIAGEAARLGHTIGNHSYDHSLLLFRSQRYVMKQVAECAEQIAQATGTAPAFFRPPYGYFRPTLLRPLRSTGHQLVMWSLDSKDWQSRTAHAVSATIVQNARPGSIVLLHDNDSTAQRIPDILKNVLDSLLGSYEFSPIPHDR